MKLILIACLFAFAAAQSDTWGQSDEADFKELDGNGDGSVTLEEVMEWNENFSGEKFDLTEEQIKKLFADEDTDGNNQVSLEEFKAGRVARNKENTELEKKGMAKLFQNADIDEDGTITVDAMIWTMRNWTGFLPFLEEHMKKDFDQADKDDDNVLTKEEWDAFIETAHDHTNLMGEVKTAMAGGEAEAVADVPAVAMQQEADVESTYGRRKRAVRAKRQITLSLGLPGIGRPAAYRRGVSNGYYYGATQPRAYGQYGYYNNYQYAG